MLVKITYAVLIEEFTKSELRNQLGHPYKFRGFKQRRLNFGTIQFEAMQSQEYHSL